MSQKAAIWSSVQRAKSTVPSMTQSSVTANTTAQKSVWRRQNDFSLAKGKALVTKYYTDFVRVI